MDRPTPDPKTGRRELVARHSIAVRWTHWLNALCLFFLLASGLQIFNAHPRLYLGKYGADNDPAVFEIASEGKGDALAEYASNLNELAMAGKIDPLVGRADEVERTIQVLCRFDERGGTV